MYYFKRIKNNDIDVVVRLNINIYNDKDIELLLDEKFEENLGCLIAGSKRCISVDNSQFIWIPYGIYVKVVRGLDIKDAPVKIDEATVTTPISVTDEEIRTVMQFLKIKPIKFVQQLETSELDTLLKRKWEKVDYDVNKDLIYKNPKKEHLDQVLYPTDRISELYKDNEMMKFYFQELLAAPDDVTKKYWARRLSELIDSQKSKKL